jgi:hypothetical protein
LSTSVKQRPTYYLSIFFIFVIINALAFIANAEEQTNNKLSDTDNGGFLEITSGIAALNSRYVDAPKSVGSVTDLRFRYYWNNFFLEYEGFKGLGFPGVGYNFYNQDSWMLDVFLTETHPAILWNEGDYIENGIINEQDGLTGITPRKSDNRWSLRATRFINDTTALRILIASESDINGIDYSSPYFAAWYGITWQHQNINFHSTFNVQYDNAQTLDYYYGVSGQDISDKFTAYTASSGVSVSAELGITYPLAIDWLLESSFKITRLPNSIYNSPLIDTRFETYTQLSLTYVLF